MLRVCTGCMHTSMLAPYGSELLAAPSAGMFMEAEGAAPCPSRWIHCPAAHRLPHVALLRAASTQHLLIPLLPPAPTPTPCTQPLPCLSSPSSPQLDANGRLIYTTQAITIGARKLHNLYYGFTDPIVYEMTPTELEVRGGSLKPTIWG